MVTKINAGRSFLFGGIAAVSERCNFEADPINPSIFVAQKLSRD